LLDLPGYDVATLVEKAGKSASHIYARLSLLQLIPEVAEAFTQERITASHANLIARLPQESQAEAFEKCWRKDWQDSEPHLLPAKHVSTWIQNNLYLSLADAPFGREDPTLNPAAGACVTCPRRSGYPMAEAFEQEITTLYEAREQEHEARRLQSSLSPRRGPRLSNLSLERFRSSTKYQDRPAAADIAFCVAAFANGMTEDRIGCALEVDYLSRDPSPSRRAAYIRRTMEKARRWAER
jgi:hypothetical protein